MVSPTRGLLRWLRAVSLGAVGFTLALTAHVAAGGAAPGAVVLLLLAGLAGLAGVLITGARLSPIRVGVFLTVTQVVLHQVFTWLAAPVGCLMTVASTPAGSHLVHGNGPILVECATGLADSGMAHSGMGQSSAFATSAMVGAHVAATALMAGLLAYGERVLWFLAGFVPTPRWLRVGRLELLSLWVVSCGVPRMYGVRFACGGVGRRGPPSSGLSPIV
jgi:hypothetical protein